MTGDQPITSRRTSVAPEVAASSSASNRLMTASEVSEILRVPRSTVYKLARNRQIPFLKVGRRTLFDQRLLSEWIASQTVQPRR